MRDWDLRMPRLDADGRARQHRPRQKTCTLVVVLLAVAACGHDGSPPGSAVDSRTPITASAQPEAAPIERVFARCAEDMVRQTCRILGNAAGASVPDDTLVFVAGIGAIDATVYNRLRADGEAMCETVRRSCRDAWDGPPCRTARALYGEA